MWLAENIGCCPVRSMRCSGAKRYTMSSRQCSLLKFPNSPLATKLPGSKKEPGYNQSTRSRYIPALDISQVWFRYWAPPCTLPAVMCCEALHNGSLTMFSLEVSQQRTIKLLGSKRELQSVVEVRCNNRGLRRYTGSG